MLYTLVGVWDEAAGRGREVQRRGAKRQRSGNVLAVLRVLSMSASGPVCLETRK